MTSFLTRPTEVKLTPCASRVRVRSSVSLVHYTEVTALQLSMAARRYLLITFLLLELVGKRVNK